MRRLLGNGLLAAGDLGGMRTYAARVLATRRSNLVAYWPLWETSGSVATDISGNARHGTYTGVTLGQRGIGDGRPAPAWDGTNDFVGAYTAGLAAAFNGGEGTALVWVNPDATTLAGATVRRVLYLAADTNNRLQIFKSTAANNLSLHYTAGATLEQVNLAFSAGDTWTPVAVTWSKTADQFRAYLNGTQQGATQTTLGAWAGALAATTTLIGASSSGGAESWHGALAHVALWDTPLTATEIAALGRAR